MYHEIAEPYVSHNLAPALKPGARASIIDLVESKLQHGTPPQLLSCELAAIDYRKKFISHAHRRCRLSRSLYREWAPSTVRHCTLSAIGSAVAQSCC
jgi:hypothetical protein